MRIRLLLVILALGFTGIACRARQVPGDNSVDADGCIWGVELYLTSDNATLQHRIKVVNDDFKVKNIKIMAQQEFFSGEGKSFSSRVCHPTPARCIESYDLDVISGVLKKNNFSVMPMFTQARGKPVTEEVIRDYVDFVDWFISRYKDSMNIKFIELVNSPSAPDWWRGTPEQLLNACNLIYDRIKKKFPSIQVGTPGFEYWLDQDDRAVRLIEPFFEKGKFDFWAFHGYPAIERMNAGITYPPTKTCINNKYAGIRGIVEIRKKLDETGHADAPIIDTEHTNILVMNRAGITQEQDALNAAYAVQELLLKKTLKYKGKFALAGFNFMKINQPKPQRRIQEDVWASLLADGSLSQQARAAVVFMDYMATYAYDSHILGAFDSDEAWIEKFVSGNKVLYVFFKPFEYTGQRLAFDGKTLEYRLNLRQKPLSARFVDIYGSKSAIGPDTDIILKAKNSPSYLEIEFNQAATTDQIQELPTETAKLDIGG